VNTEDQTVKITLKEYVEYQELLTHKKEVKLITITRYRDREDIESSSILWMSDGKIWNKLCRKLESANLIIEDLLKQLNDKEEEKHNSILFPYFIDFIARKNLK